MKTAKVVFLLLAVCLLASAGCKRADQQGSAQQFHGINVDWSKFDAEFARAGQAVQDSFDLVKRYFRYAQFPEALTELDKLSKDPGLTEPQKKLVMDLIEQTKLVIAKTPLPPGQ